MASDHVPKNFLERLQQSDEGTKTRWVIGLSVLAMVVVVFLWLSYFNNLVIRRTPSLGESGEEAKHNTPFLETMENGVASIYRTLGSGAENLLGILRGPKVYTIEPQGEK